MLAERRIASLSAGFVMKRGKVTEYLAGRHGKLKEDDGEETIKQVITK